MTYPILDNGGPWVRATHTEHCDEYPDWSRPYHLQMPLLTEDLDSLMAYPIHEELAFCLPVALPGPQQELARGDKYGYLTDSSNAIESRFFRFEGYCKAALFLARQMLHQWDVRKTGVPIFIGVSANGLDIFRGYAAHCNFPEDRIVVLPDYEQQGHAWHSKFDLLGAPELHRFTRRVHFDVSLWLNTTTSSAPCSSLLGEWDSPKKRQWAFLVDSIKNLPGKRWQPLGGGSLTDTYYAELAKILGTTLDVERNFWEQECVPTIAGQIVGIVQDCWEDSRFLSLLTALKGLEHSDEVILSVLAKALPITEDSAVLQLWRFFHLRYMPPCARRRDQAPVMEAVEAWREVHG